MKKIFFTICIVTLITVGAGCSSKPQTTAPTSTPQNIKKEELSAKKTKTPAQNFCEASGYELIIRFDKETQGPKSFCRFKDSSECPADDFFSGKCSTDQSAKSLKPNLNNKIPNLVACSANYEPVCGADGVNYTNSCVAQAQGIKIAHNGVCVNKDIIEAQENEQPQQTVVNTDSGDSQNATETMAVEKLSPENWLPVVKDLVLSNPPSDPPAFIEKCVIAGKTYYFRSDGCSSCFTTLYDTAGEPICYPSNDMNGSCPASFDKAYRAQHCSRVWQDPR